jgi:hypothetical protein
MTIAAEEVLQIGTPPRRRRSIRRTTVHDSNRPEGFDGPVAHVATGRDLVTDAQGQATMVDSARVMAQVDYYRTAILALAADPPEPALSALIGKSAYAGFRKSIETVLPGEIGSHSLRAQLFDDLPAAVMGNGRALRAEGIRITLGTRSKLPVDLCAGWVEGGTMARGYTDLGPPLLVGPRAAALELPADPLSWHAIDALAPHGTRRCRRLDVWEDAAGRGWADCFFRDSHVDRNGGETVIHEWRLLAEFDVPERCFVGVKATAGALPYPECPGSGASAERLAGMPIDGLRAAVRQGFVGPSTCTHLNDSLRALEDVGSLLECLGVSA